MAKRGEVWQVDFGMAQKVRPALVISVPYDDSDRALIAVVPHTTAIRGSRFEVVLPVRFLEPGVNGGRKVRRCRLKSETPVPQNGSSLLSGQVPHDALNTFG